MTDKPNTIELWEIGKLVPYEANAKKHPPEQVTKLATAITKFGWTQPIIVWTNGEIIAGHGRRLAALELGLKKVPVICRRDLSKAQADALRLADNRVTSTDYDQGAIQAELQRLADDLAGGTESFDMMDLGFDAKEIEFSLAPMEEMDESWFVEDVSGALDAQKEANNEAIKATDDVASPVVDALGFKRVTIAQSRALSDLMTRAAAKTGKIGVEALIDALSLAL